MANGRPSSVHDVTAEPPSPPSPTASFYDMSDDDEGGYNTIKHTKTGKGVKLLYAKSKVYVHPTPSAKDNIPGYVALIQQKPEEPAPTSPGSSAGRRDKSGLLLAWVPESGLGKASEIYTKVRVLEREDATAAGVSPACLQHTCCCMPSHARAVRCFS